MVSIFQKRRNIIIFLGIYAFAIMLLCAGSSPLIQYLSIDSSIFYAMGRSAAAGKVLYKEVADHKGWYLFAFNWLGSAISPHNMYGLFIVEVLFAWSKLLFGYQIAYSFLKDNKRSIMATALFMLVACNFFQWGTGDLGENFAVLFQLISLSLIVRYYFVCQKKLAVSEHKPIYMFIHGVCAGITFLIQANLVAMWIPFGIVLAYALLKTGLIKNFLYNLLTLLTGIMVAFLPAILYAVITNSLSDMLFFTFEFNMMYADSYRGSQNILSFAKDIFLSPSILIVFWSILGCIVTVKYIKCRWFSIMYCSMTLFTFVLMNISLTYNPIYLTSLIVFGLPFGIWLFSKLNTNKFLIYMVALFFMTIVMNMQLIKKTLNIGSSASAYKSAYEMSKLMDHTNNEDTLVLGSSLYYNCTDKIPPIRLFTRFAIDKSVFDGCQTEPIKSLISGENRYVILECAQDSYDTWEDDESNIITLDYLKTNYEILLDYNEGGKHAVLYEKK